MTFGEQQWNPGTGDRILLAGTSASLPVITMILATLPAKARGQVFIEVDFADEIEPITAPSRFCITWLVRSNGQDLARTVAAWLSEMLPVSGTEEHSVYAWIEADGAPRVLSSELF